MIDIQISPAVKNAAPSLKILQIEASVINRPTTDDLWKDIISVSERLKESFSLESLNKRPSIAGTRLAYKTLGKDPNRYRPSAEALGRRVLQDKGLYRLNSLVDIINLVSLETGYSIGGFEKDKIKGQTLLLDRGAASDIFHGIGRGLLNIEGLPVYKDSEGGIGTPTSDEERTKLSLETSNILILVNIYREELPVPQTEAMIRKLLEDYASLSSFSSRVIAIE